MDCGIMAFTTFQKLEKRYQTIDAAERICKKIMDKKSKIFSKINKSTGNRTRKKWEIMEYLSRQESLYLDAIKTQTLSQIPVNDQHFHFGAVDDSLSGTDSDDDLYTIMGDMPPSQRVVASQSDVVDRHQSLSPHHREADGEEKVEVFRSTALSPAAPSRAHIPSPHSMHQYPTPTPPRKVRPNLRLKVNIPFTHNSRIRKVNKRREPPPCTPTESTSGESRFEFNFEEKEPGHFSFEGSSAAIPASSIRSAEQTDINRLSAVRSMEPEPGALGMAMSIASRPYVMTRVIALGIAKILMKYYPLPQRIEKLKSELRDYAADFDGNFHDEFEKDIGPYVFITIVDSWWYVHPERLVPKLKLYERQMMIQRKLDYLLTHVHPDGIYMENQNRDRFFEHYIGWGTVTKEDGEVWLKVLQRATKRYNGDDKRLRSRHIMSFGDMILCAIHALGDRGVNQQQLVAEFKKWFGLGLDCGNPFIRRKLQEKTVRNGGVYRLKDEVKENGYELLKWWTDNYLKAKPDQFAEHNKFEQTGSDRSQSPVQHRYAQRSYDHGSGSENDSGHHHGFSPDPFEQRFNHHLGCRGDYIR